MRSGVCGGSRARPGQLVELAGGIDRNTQPGRVVGLFVAPWAISWDPDERVAYGDPAKTLCHNFVMARSPLEYEPAQRGAPRRVVSVGEKRGPPGLSEPFGDPGGSLDVLRAFLGVGELALGGERQRAGDVD